MNNRGEESNKDSLIIINILTDFYKNIKMEV